MVRLPIVDSDDGTWGAILRDFIMKEHLNDDNIATATNGGHKTITIAAGTASAGTAPIKFTSGTLLTTPEAGALEFNTDRLYFTQTTGTTRKTIATYDDSSGATGDIYYRNGSGYFTRLAAGSNGTLLAITGGIPTWVNSFTVTDNQFTFADDLSGTKQMQFQLSGVTAGQTRILTVPDANTTLVGTDVTQTLTNKTLTTPRISQINDANGNTILSLTAVASAVNSLTLFNGAAGQSPAFYAAGSDSNLNIIMVPKGTGRLMIRDGTDNSKIVGLNIATVGTGQTRTWSFPDVSSTFVGTDATQTLTNKSLTSPTLTGTATVANITVTATGDNGVNFANTLTNTSGTITGIQAQATINPAATSSAQFRAFNMSATIPTTNAETFSNAIYGAWIETRYQGTGSPSTLIGSRSSNVLPAAAQSFGTIASAFGFEVQGLSEFASTNITGTITNATGLRVTSHAKTSSNLTVTTNIGLDVQAQTIGSTSNIGVRIAAAGNYALQMSDTGGTAAGGITFGTDTNLYRSAANTLRTDDTLIVGTPGTATGSVVTIDGTQTLTNKTLTSPVFSNSVQISSNTGGGDQVVVDNTNTAGRAEIVFQEGAAVKGAFQYRGTTNSLIPNTFRFLTQTGTNADLILGTNGNSYFFIAGGQNGLTVGNIGLGTTTPGNRLELATSTSSAGGIGFGTDTNLYRSAANVLRTDDTLIVGTPGTAAGSVVTVDGAQTLTNKTMSSLGISGSINLEQSATLSSYNTIDQVTNYERARAYWSSNIFVLTTENGGTGSLRAMQLNGASSFINLTSSGLSMGRSTTSNANIVTSQATLAASSGVQNLQNVSPTVNQSGTAGYTALNINVTESATGSGTKKLIDASVGGSSKFWVDNTGVANVAAVGTAAGSVVSVDGAQTLTNKTISGSSNTLSNIALSSLSTTGTANSATFLRGDGQWTAVSAGGITRTFVTTSGNYSAGSTASTDYIYIIAGAHSGALPSANGNANRYTFKNNHSVGVTITRGGSDTIEGDTSITIMPGESVDLISNGTDTWNII